MHAQKVYPPDKNDFTPTSLLGEGALPSQTGFVETPIFAEASPSAEPHSDIEERVHVAISDGIAALNLSNREAAQVANSDDLYTVFYNAMQEYAKNKLLEIPNEHGFETTA
mgnify:CR=1 FL=1